jgi:hypothetical protein
MDPSQLDLMGLEDDPGKWMPFSFLIGIVTACKLATDDSSLSAYGCTTVFTTTGDSYVIDTPYEEFEKIFEEYHLSLEDDNEGETGNGENDITL